jgi:hypothetical protein
MGNQIANIIDLYENSVIKHLIQVLDLSGIPIGTIIDAQIAIRIDKYKARKLKIFFDELNDGKVTLTEDIIDDNDFLHAYFTTVNYSLRARSDQKIKRFAMILKNLYKKDIDFDTFEDLISIFNDLSDREFKILAIKLSFEEVLKNDDVLYQMENNMSYWNEFKELAMKETGLTPDELNPILLRIQRTGCYLKLNNYLGDSTDETGVTTTLFKKIHSIVSSEV